MKQVLFAMPGNEALAAAIAASLQAEAGEAMIRRFPDGESYVRILSEVKDRHAVLICTLDRPDEKFLPLYYLCKGLKEMGASTVTLVAPYLAYMRQDKRFNEGEVVSSGHFAQLLSSCCDELITIDPHLHRRKLMAEIYSIPCKVLHASPLISAWIKARVDKPLLIGPDAESEQWVAQVAAGSGAPYIILEKNRHGDRDVSITMPQVQAYPGHTPVLVDDIISTAHTMMETVQHLLDSGSKAPLCIGIHAVFADTAYDELLRSGAGMVITCNTIPHSSNGIDISGLLSDALGNA